MEVILTSPTILWIKRAYQRGPNKMNIKNKFKKPCRVMVNQPSTLQPYYKLHGRYGIAHTEECGITYIHFTEGALHSQQIDVGALDIIKISGAED
jgi:hypothetical protein